MTGLAALKRSLSAAADRADAGTISLVLVVHDAGAEIDIPGPVILSFVSSQGPVILRRGIGEIGAVYGGRGGTGIDYRFQLSPVRHPPIVIAGKDEVVAKDHLSPTHGPLPNGSIVASIPYSIRGPHQTGVVIYGNQISSDRYGLKIKGRAGLNVSVIPGLIGEGLAGHRKATDFSRRCYVAEGSEIYPGDTPYRPEAVSSPEDRDIVRAVTIIISRFRLIGLVAEIDPGGTTNRPETGRWPEDGRSGRSIPIVVTRDRLVRQSAEIEPAHPPHRPEAGTYPEDGYIIHPVSIEVR